MLYSTIVPVPITLASVLSGLLPLKDLSPVLGLEGYSSILSQMKEANIEIPVVAIGGITYEDIPAILHTGVNGIALSGTILGADNPIEETRRILNHA